MNYENAGIKRAKGGPREERAQKEREKGRGRKMGKMEGEWGRRKEYRTRFT